MIKTSPRRARSGIWLRVLGSTGLFVALLGLIPLSTTMDLGNGQDWLAAVRRFGSESTSLQFSNRFQAASLAMIGIGGIVFLAALLIQTLSGLRTIAGRRNVAATNAVVQTALAVALLIGVNVYSFRHYKRLDWTRNQQFTLPTVVAKELGKLNGQTDIIVYQRHKTFGRLSEKPDAYDYAAERKVVEKVQDLVEQFREFGPQFRVEVLDIESEGYEDKLDGLTQDAPALRTAIAAAPDNSIFFHTKRAAGLRADGKPDIRENVQRLSFNEFYQLDKTESLGKSVIVLFQKKAGGGEAESLAAIERRVRHLTDPDAAEGPDIKLFVLRGDDADFARQRDQAAAEAEALKPLLDDLQKDRNAENTAIVVKDGETRRYGFPQFAALTDVAAREALKPRGNLVLLPQGVGPFAGKVLAVEERRPKIGLAVIHEWLTTDGLDEFTLAGLKKSLATQGFDVLDIVLKKKWGEGPEPEPAAYTLEESKYERLIEDLAEVEANLEQMNAIVRQLTAALEQFRTLSLEELTRRYRAQLGGRPFTEKMRELQIAAITADLQTLEYVVKQNNEARKQYEDEKNAIGAQERVVEERRMTDLKAKLATLLADCDMLIVPRMTLRDVVSGYSIPPRLYRLDAVQTEAIKDFLKAGKPVLACFGPTNEPADSRMPRTPGGDSVENLLAQFGIVFGKQTILFGSEGKALAERRSNPLATGSTVKVPPLRFDAPKSTPWLSGFNLFAENPIARKPNAIAASMDVTKRNLGGKRKLDLEVRHPRPIYFVPIRPDDGKGEKTAAAEFLFTDPDAWNEDDPFPTQKRTPRFEPPKPDDPARGTRDERRRGAFPIGVAIETTVPAEWFDPNALAFKAASLAGDGADELAAAAALAAENLVPADAYAKPDLAPVRVRLGAIGHGGWFVGPELSPAKEGLLVTICNWLLQRDERLPQADSAPWRYPRAALDDRSRTLWKYGAMLALPGFFIYLGRLVLLRRRMR